MRKALILGNWKMYGSRRRVTELSQALANASTAFRHADVGVCAAFPYLIAASEILAGSGVLVGAQDVCAEVQAEGAYTGEVSAAMLQDCGATLVLIGHSERRELYGETDARVLAKVQTVLAAGLTAVVCVGERLEAREQGTTLAVIERQLAGLIAALAPEQWDRVVIAYEPVWAIGTGKTATPQQAQDVHAFVREVIAKAHAVVAPQVRIIYGGSVKPDNAAELFGQNDIDGALVGGASLKPDDFAAIIACAE
jgi:triosephosphate isomerase (TIM)